MFVDDDMEPRAVAPKTMNLDALSVEELHAYIEDLEAEIERVKATISERQKYFSGAESVFKKR